MDTDAFAHFFSLSNAGRADALGYADADALVRAEYITQRVADGSLGGSLARDVADDYARRLAGADGFTGAECDVECLVRAARADRPGDHPAGPRA